MGGFVLCGPLARRAREHVGGSQAGIEGRRAGFELRDTITVISQVMSRAVTLLALLL